MFKKLVLKREEPIKLNNKVRKIENRKVRRSSKVVLRLTVKGEPS